MKIKGVHWDKRENRYRAYLRVDGKLIYLGAHKDPKIAEQLYLAARAKYPDKRRRIEKIKPTIKNESSILELPRGLA